MVEAEDVARPAAPESDIVQYSASTKKLATAFTAPSLLETLLLRDAIERAIRSGKIDHAGFNQILATDKALQSLPRHLFYAERQSFIQYRRSLTPSAEAWWWFLDRALPARIARLERIALLLSVVLFPFSLGVAIELARLYGTDSLGLISLLPIAATFLGSLSLGGVLSLSFRDRWTELLEEIGFGPRLRVGLTCVLFVLLTGIIALWFARPWFSRHYNDAGVSALVKRQLSTAQMNLERGVRFDPANRVAHYNLGRVCEDLLDDDRAMSEYLIAFAADLDLAGNNAGHLYLLRGQYDRAAFVLQRTGTKSGDGNLRYAVLKNLGWARFGQSRFPEARQLLDEAIRLDPDRADAHCLMAKTLSAMKDGAAQDEWRRCLGLAWRDTNDPASETWIGEAKAIPEKAP